MPNHLAESPTPADVLPEPDHLSGDANAGGQKIVYGKVLLVGLCALLERDGTLPRKEWEDMLVDRGISRQSISKSRPKLASRGLIAEHDGQVNISADGTQYVSEYSHRIDESYDVASEGARSKFAPTRYLAMDILEAAADNPNDGWLLNDDDPKRAPLMQHLEDVYGLSKPNASQVIARLRRDGLVEATNFIAGKHRKTIMNARLTEEGKQALAEIRESSADLIDSLYEHYRLTILDRAREIFLMRNELEEDYEGAPDIDGLRLCELRVITKDQADVMLELEERIDTKR